MSSSYKDTVYWIRVHLNECILTYLCLSRLPLRIWLLSEALGVSILTDERGGGIDYKKYIECKEKQNIHGSCATFILSQVLGACLCHTLCSRDCWTHHCPIKSI